jgi:hypothetical protein
MIPAVQGLGRIDTALAVADAQFLALSDTERTHAQISNLHGLADRVTQSYLWVLGVYEIVRAIDQKCRSGSAGVTEAQSGAVRETKRKFERVRMPLAKFEPAQRHSETDSAIAYPSIEMDHGIAWRISQETIVSREELARTFHKMLEVLCASA